MGRIAVIGDIGGHADELYAALVGLGADPATGELPEDLTVIQLGDLVHRGPNSTGVLDLVEAQLDSGRWIQLIGNHEANELLAQPVFIFENLDEADRERLRAWRSAGKLHVAAAVVDDWLGEVLITHAGLTVGFFEAIRQPQSARAAAAALNAILPRRQGLAGALSHAGLMLGRRGPSSDASPLWAHAGHEVCPGWMNKRMPFHQVHGHTSMYHWSRKTFDAPIAIADATVVDVEKRHTVTTVGGGQKIMGVDPCLGAYAGVRWQPLVLNGDIAAP